MGSNVGKPLGLWDSDEKKKKERKKKTLAQIHWEPAADINVDCGPHLLTRKDKDL